MPCRTDWEDNATDLVNENYELRKQVRMLVPMLCAAMELLKENYGSFQQAYELLNYAEAGVDKTDFVAWHTEHAEQDRIRREQEREAQRVANIKSLALSKLTLEEKQILGLVK